MAYGKNEFIQNWGERQLEDNWRWSSNTVTSSNILAEAINLENGVESELFDPQFYISQIPTAQKTIDSLVKDRNFAYYQLGLIYKEKFAEYHLAKDKLQALLKNNPEEFKWFWRGRKRFDKLKNSLRVSQFVEKIKPRDRVT